MRITGEETDEAIMGELGARLRRLRLRQNVTQGDLATEAGVSSQTVRKAEDGGSVRLSSLIRLMRALGVGGGIQGLVPEESPSPLELLDRQGRERQRAARSAERPGTEDER